MENKDIKLKNKIMRRVYAVWILKKILSMDFAMTALFVVLLAEFLIEVSVVSVFGNLPHGISSVASYIMMAFSNTEATVQMYIVLMSLISAWIIGERIAGQTSSFSFIRSKF